MKKACDSKIFPCFKNNGKRIRKKEMKLNSNSQKT